MIFPVTGFPCAATVQRRLGGEADFYCGRIVLRSFAEATRLRSVLGLQCDEIFVSKAAWLSEILHRILLRTYFTVALPEETQKDTARFLAVAEEDVSLSLAGLLWLSAMNPALSSLSACFAGSEKIARLNFLEATPAGQRLLRLLTDHAASIDDQLEALILHMPAVLEADERELLRRVIAYDRGARFFSTGGTPAYRQFIVPGGAISRSQDEPWMRELVLLAKIVPVWLADLSRRHHRHIGRLDEIPEEEIASIASFGIGGIWLVGLWQRSAASARIKQLTGGKNYSSAYSVFDYAVADEWGGHGALRSFRDLCARYGIRLGCDMVPNHTGIDSKWMREHPEWFMQSEVNPFPGYTFNGENLSGVQGIEIRIEDHYYEKSDAAVVFACDRDGRRRYIYHGNDGTGLPWNDTAQLDHTLADVRQAIIDTALALSADFDIIRFDAAMTLTRDHYRRLWFPRADEAPAIASRSVYSLPGHEFDARMPREFWTELVNAFRERRPGTLLVAEAFWMTEMYFVRSLGLNRVYNSAFMHSLRDEKNQEFESTLRDFRSHDADTLARFANYLSTPDEEAAAAHFPNDDKYIGAMVLMATLPGLPLIAPGQLEGYREKYGMDQEKPYLNETIRSDLADRFRAQITPLFKRRAEFADPLALTFVKAEKSDNCIAFATGRSERMLVMFNNSPHATRVVIAADEFSALFSPEGAEFAWRDLLTMTEYQTSRSKVRADGCIIDLAPYASVVFGGFHAYDAAQAKPVTHYPLADRYYSGVAVPVSALKSANSCGIGEFADLRLLIDWCVATRQQMINILPVNDTGNNSSPYSALSAMALHPVYICLNDLQLNKALAKRVQAFAKKHAGNARVHFDEVVNFKLKLLREVYLHEAPVVPQDFAAEQWVRQYAVYRCLKDQFDGAPWFAWPLEHQEPYSRAQIENYLQKHPSDTGFYIWLQYVLDNQLREVRAYADERGVYIKGDMPIMLERDSADVWLYPQLFNHKLRAGAPPDMFSPEGQNWGFPVYNWSEHFAEDFAWWRERIRRLDRYFSAYRIDHVLGFFRLWCIPEGKHSGRDGYYLPADAAEQLAQGKKILSVLRETSNMLPCAEDLGVVPDYVRPALAELGILSLKVYRWEAENNIPKDPQGYPFLSLATSSVHDSSNLREWLATEDGKITGVVVSNGAVSVVQINEFLSRLYRSPSMIVMIPLQDLLALEDKLHGKAADERINVPGTVTDFNWTYRMPLSLEELLSAQPLRDSILSLTQQRPVLNPRSPA